MDRLELLEQLCTAPGISGDESAVRTLITAEIKSAGLKYTVDPMGNVICHKPGKEAPAQPILLAAHMDEVGLIVTHICEDGLLKFAHVGGIDSRVLIGKSVHVNERLGIIGAKPVHLLDDDELSKVPDDLYIDIGAKDKDEAKKYVSPGDSAVFLPFFRKQNNNILARALDDRIGCFVLLQLLREELAYDTVFTFNVQEEIGLRGAVTTAFAVNPGSAVIVECTSAADIAGVTGAKTVCKLGGGAVVTFMDNGTIYDKDYYRLAWELAEKHDIPIQTKSMVAGGNDASSIQKSRGGTRVLAVSLPCRFLHAPVGIINQNDVHAVLKLIPLLIAEMG